jgi:dihydropteroate synthase
MKEVDMNVVPLARKNIEEKPVVIDFSKKSETRSEFLSEEEALALTAKVIEKYRPALEELAK